MSARIDLQHVTAFGVVSAAGAYQQAQGGFFRLLCVPFMLKLEGIADSEETYEDDGEGVGRVSDSSG